MIRKRERRENVIVVLEGAKAAIDDKGIAPLKWAFREVLERTDDLLVLTIINPTCSSSLCSEVHHHHQESIPCQGDEFIQFLQGQINQRRDGYRQILRPYYEKCKSNGVKFQVKVAVGFQPNLIVIEEANRFRATWVVMDRCFGGDLSLHDDCNIAIVNDEGEAEDYINFYPGEGSGNSRGDELINFYPGEGSGTSRGDELVSYSAHREESENPIVTTNEEIIEEEKGLEDFRRVERDGFYDNAELGRCSEPMLIFREPLNLSFQKVLIMTGGFQSSCISQHEEFDMYDGFLNDPHYHVMVKRLRYVSCSIVEAEKQATSSLFHRNILGLTAYHVSINGTVLVYGLAAKGNLDQYLYGSRSLTFQNKMKIAIEIGLGLRYMHDESPASPVVHGNLQPCSIFLSQDFQPLISGFGRTRWLQQEQLVVHYPARCTKNDRSCQESLELIKSDIFAFGILLLRLFCMRSMPRDDGDLMELARPSLQQGAFHELLDQDMEDLDMYEIYRVMSAATQCTKDKAISRPTMNQVVSILRGENSCVYGSSPSSDGSVRGGANHVFS